MIAWALERRRADEAYLARFQNLDVLYLVPFHFRRRAATERYLCERNFSELISATARSDSAPLFSATIPVCFPASRLSDVEAERGVSDSILSL